MGSWRNHWSLPFLNQSKMFTLYGKLSKNGLHFASFIFTSSLYNFHFDYFNHPLFKVPFLCSLLLLTLKSHCIPLPHLSSFLSPHSFFFFFSFFFPIHSVAFEKHQSAFLVHYPGLSTFHHVEDVKHAV